MVIQELWKHKCALPLVIYPFPAIQRRNKNASRVAGGKRFTAPSYFTLFSFNMCITALQNDRRDGLYIPCTKQRIFQKMFIYMLFYIDLTVQLDRTIERLMLQKFVRFFVGCCFDCMFCVMKIKGNGKGRRYYNTILYFYFEYI